MQILNELLPTGPGRIKAMQEAGPDGPIVMVNMLKFHEYAQYPDEAGNEAQISGREAYMRYARVVMKILPDFGGHSIFAGNVSWLMIGQVEDLWDEIVLIEYPNRGQLLAMSLSEQWKAASVHRQAGLAGQLNIETTAMNFTK